MGLPACLIVERRKPNPAPLSGVPFHVKQPNPVPGAIGPIVLFDGVCNLCNATVLFIIERDPYAHFRFAALQSSVGARLLERHDVSAGTDSVVVIDEDEALVESDAAMRIARHLGWPWRAAGLLRVIPRPLRDGLYRWIARNRYRWFGRSDACRVPTPALSTRFLDAPAAPLAG